MTAKPLATISPDVRGDNWQRAFWLGLCLVLVFAAASALVYFANTRAASVPPATGVQARLNTARNAQSLRAHPNLAPTCSSSQAPAAPGAGNRGQCVTTNSIGRSHPPRALPVAAARSLLDYLRPPSPIAVGQAVPDAATQGVLNYLRAHGVQ